MLAAALLEAEPAAGLRASGRAGGPRSSMARGAGAAGPRTAKLAIGENLTWRDPQSDGFCHHDRRHDGAGVGEGHAARQTAVQHHTGQDGDGLDGTAPGPPDTGRPEKAGMPVQRKAGKRRATRDDTLDDGEDVKMTPKPSKRAFLWRWQRWCCRFLWNMHVNVHNLLAISMHVCIT